MCRHCSSIFFFSLCRRRSLNGFIVLFSQLMWKMVRFSLTVTREIFFQRKVSKCDSHCATYLCVIYTFSLRKLAMLTRFNPLSAPLAVSFVVVCRMATNWNGNGRKWINGCESSVTSLQISFARIHISCFVFFFLLGWHITKTKSSIIFYLYKIDLRLFVYLHSYQSDLKQIHILS